MYYYFYGLCEFALATNLGVRKKSRCVGEILGKVYPGYMELGGILDTSGMHIDSHIAFYSHFSYGD